MDNFKKIFRKVNGVDVLKQYARAHVLMFALVETALLGTSKKSLEIVRLAVQNKMLTKLRRKYQKKSEKIKQEIDSESLVRKQSDKVWICWFQGMDNAPTIVQRCFQSIKQNIKGKEIIVITEENFSQYTDLPQYVVDKYKKGIISRTQFSDILRLEVLIKYGGTWIDSTVFCSSNNIPDFMLSDDLFVFQSLKPGLDGHATQISSWFITSGTNHPILKMTRELLLDYWSNHNVLVDYFLFHDFFQIAIENYPEEWNKVVPVSNSIPHILLLRLFDTFDQKMYDSICQMTCFHKLSYKNIQNHNCKECTYYTKIMNGGGQ